MKLLRVLRRLSILVSAALMIAPAGAQIRFASPVTYDAGPGVESVAVADLRRDGRLDLVVADFCDAVNQNGNCTTGEGGVSVLFGNGDGTFQPAVTYGTGAYSGESVAVGDVNGDGVPDLVVSDWCMFQNCRPGNGAVSVLLGNGDGTFQPPVVYDSGGLESWSVALGDLRGYGKLDIVVTNTYGKSGQDGSVGVLLGNGDGTFQPAVSYDSGRNAATSVAIGDVNGDGIPDLVVDNNGSYDGKFVAILLGNGDGTFQPAVTYSSGGGAPDSIAVADLRENGILDVVVANRVTDGWDGWKHSNVGVLLGNGDGTFQPAVTYKVGGVSPSDAIGPGYNSLVLADVNGDGIPDVEVVRWCARTDIYGNCYGNQDVSVLVGNGDGSFQQASVYSSGGFIGSALAVADVNRDGRPDLLVANYQVAPNVSEGSVAVLLNRTSYKTTTALTSSPNPSQVNQPVTFTATIASSLAIPNGEVVTFYAGTTKLGKATTTNGVATLTTSFSKANTYTVKAKYPGDVWHKPSYGTVYQVVNP